MIPVGFEFGFVNKLDVVKTTPDWWEIPSYDISKFIKHIVEIKKKHPILSYDATSVDMLENNPDISMFVKRNKLTDQIALFVVNKNTTSKVKRIIDFPSVFGYYDAIDVIDNVVMPKYAEVTVPRAGIKVFVNRIH